MTASGWATMWSVARRIAGGLLVLLGAVTLTFVAMHALPGSLEDTILGTASSDSARQQLRADLGLDRPLVAQYVSFLGDLVRGDLGWSYKQNRAVSTVIGDSLGPTLQLAGAALTLAVVGSTVVALSTVHRPLPRRVAVAAERLAVSTPSFWVGIVLLQLFSFHWRVFPVTGDGLRAIVLPAVTLSFAAGAVLSQVLRHGLVKALDQPFVLTARTRGLSGRQVLVRHVFRHALAPTVTLVGWMTGALISGAIVVEQVFARPGLGRTTLAAISGGDLYVVTGVVLFAAAVFVAVNLLVDLVYRLIDPRLRQRRGGASSEAAAVGPADAVLTPVLTDGVAA